MDGSICVLGLGLMGRPIAQTLLAAGYGVMGWNRSPRPAHVVAGITLTRTMKDAASAAVCILVLADSDAVDAVIGQLEPHLPPGGLVIDMGTSDPSRSRAHASRLTAKGIGWVDAPVSGGPEGAAKSSLAIMAGGSEPDFARARPVLEKLGRVVRVGEAGAGHTMKIVNQLIVGLTIEAVGEGVKFGRKGCVVPPLGAKTLGRSLVVSMIFPDTHSYHITPSSCPY